MFCSSQNPRIPEVVRLLQPHPRQVFIQIDEISRKPSLLNFLCSSVATFLTVTFWYLIIPYLWYVEISRDGFGNFIVGYIMEI